MNRFALSATGLVAASASAAPIEINVTFDRWVSEAGVQVFNSASSLVGSFYVSGGYVYAGGALSIASFAYNGSGYSSPGYDMIMGGDLAAGTYTIVLTDTYGDGWGWGGVPGGVSGYGLNASGDPLAFTTSAGSVAGTFTVVPAPAGLALLGLAGLSRRRRG